LAGAGVPLNLADPSLRPQHFAQAAAAAMKATRLTDSPRETPHLSKSWAPLFALSVLVVITSLPRPP